MFVVVVAMVINKLVAEKKPPRMGPDEKRLVREMHFDRHMRPTDIATSIGRDLSSICRLLAQKKVPNPSGGRAALSKEQVDRAVKVLDGARRTAHSASGAQRTAHRQKTPPNYQQNLFMYGSTRLIQQT